MYTQCPDCSTAFRVTAALLQQAAGRVRCGNCGHAFNALEHLSEDPPPAADDAQTGGEPEADPLIDTFTDSSAFDDVRIEDTGVEWRVIEDDEEDGAGGEADTGAVRWYPAEDDIGPAGDDGPPGSGDATAADWPDDEDGTGILVEESGIRSREEMAGRIAGDTGQEALDLDPEEPRYDDNTPLPEEFEAAIAASAAAEETPQRRASDHVEPRSAEFDERQEDLALGDSDDWRDLLDEFDGATAATAGAQQDDTADASPSAVDFDTGAGASPAVDFAVRGDDATTGAEAVDFDTGDAASPADASNEFADAFASDRAADEREARAAREREEALEAELTAAFAPDDETPDAPRGGGEEEAFDVLLQTEEERTVNMQIDEDLMRLAAEAGFTSTMTGERWIPEDSLLVETIVMEGDFVRSAMDKELDAVAETVAGSDDDPRLLLDSYLKSAGPVRGGRRRTDPPSYKVIGGVILLALLLTVQVVHAYRETLATYGAFNHTVGSVYRLFGDPLVPAWDVRGWRFESTSGSTDAGDEVLTIHSRISNQSGSALPYPLLHVALTDRFEEIIGSRVLEPADYLGQGGEDGQGGNPSSTVAPGDAFSAVITVEALSREATGFKLNVCYHEAAERLRCATEDFRN